MPDNPPSTPRVYLARHGETTWSLSGRYTSLTDLPLTPHGTAQVLSTSRLLIGPAKLIDPARLAHIFVSPRLRAQQTSSLLFNSVDGAAEGKEGLVKEEKVTTTEALAEWQYGAYEGLMTKEIRERREKAGLDGEGWDIWRDGCEGGESPQQITTRLDALIYQIREIQSPYMHGEKPVDVVLIAHGHILRAFTKRWLGYPLEMPLSMMMEPGAIGILSYQHHNIEEPAFLLGMGFPA